MDPNDVTLKNLAIFQRYIHTFRPYRIREDNLPTPNLQVFFLPLQPLPPLRRNRDLAALKLSKGDQENRSVGNDTCGNDME